ncbi:glycine cleavage system protein GcvH [Halorussus sp. MSC15.2]|uniref:glycine cleavage system protein GcvH n=1 Tax=Halorussus sp. MSC15.2 TaxID=2283638 RepID=UPI0013D78E7E|nr:glycine cleavage system protein GcvH [Halorussus sp. MSC15.2]NEU56120.1 glycine cleavage system protein GcvH [Halorussus sp. MSC15.2]
MSFEVPDDRTYSSEHEWVETTDGTARVGITDFAQDELGDVVFVELPDEGEDLTAGEEFGVVESIKAVSDLYAPVNGTVTAVNDALADQPELVNDDPFGEGWMLEVELAEDSGLDELLSAEEYREQIE